MLSLTSFGNHHAVSNALFSVYTPKGMNEKSCFSNRVGKERKKEQQRLRRRGIALHRESARAMASHRENVTENKQLATLLDKHYRKYQKMNKDQTFTVRCTRAAAHSFQKLVAWRHLGSTRSGALHHEGQLGKSHRPPPANSARPTGMHIKRPTTKRGTLAGEKIRTLDSTRKRRARSVDHSVRCTLFKWGHLTAYLQDTIDQIK